MQMLLLGAGASVPAGMPTSKGLQGLIRDQLDNESDLLAEWDRVGKLLGVDDDLENRMEYLFNLEMAARTPQSLETPLAERLRTSVNNILARTLEFKGDSSKLAYLDPVMRLAREQEGLVIATLNFDDVIERACDKNGITWSHGVKNGGAELDFQSATVHLLKLHGSTRWVSLIGKETGELFAIEFDVDFSYPEDSTWDKRAMLIGRPKLVYNYPFPQLLARFGEDLLRHDKVTVIGYSFRDDHVNEMLRLWLKSRRNVLLTIVNPDWPVGKDPFERRSLRLVRNPPQNKRIRFISKGCEDALPGLFLQNR